LSSLLLLSFSTSSSYFPEFNPFSVFFLEIPREIAGTTIPAFFDSSSFSFYLPFELGFLLYFFSKVYYFFTDGFLLFLVLAEFFSPFNSTSILLSLLSSLSYFCSFSKLLELLSLEFLCFSKFFYSRLSDDSRLLHLSRCIFFILFFSLSPPSLLLLSSSADSKKISSFSSSSSTNCFFLF